MQSWRGSRFEPSAEVILVWFEKLRPPCGVVLPRTSSLLVAWSWRVVVVRSSAGSWRGSCPTASRRTVATSWSSSCASTSRSTCTATAARCAVLAMTSLAATSPCQRLTSSTCHLRTPTANITSPKSSFTMLCGRKMPLIIVGRGICTGCLQNQPNQFQGDFQDTFFKIPEDFFT